MVRNINLFGSTTVYYVVGAGGAAVSSNAQVILAGIPTFMDAGAVTIVNFNDDFVRQGRSRRGRNGGWRVEERPQAVLDQSNIMPVGMEVQVTVEQTVVVEGASCVVP